MLIGLSRFAATVLDGIGGGEGVASGTVRSGCGRFVELHAAVIVLACWRCSSFSRRVRKRSSRASFTASIRIDVQQAAKHMMKMIAPTAETKRMRSSGNSSGARSGGASGGGGGTLVE